MKNDLNKITIPGDQYCQEYELKDNSVFGKEICVFFKNQKEQLIKLISEYDVILGCVAWLTDFDILNALSKKEVSIIVQKEDFLRPDITSEDSKTWKSLLRNAYSKLKFNYIRYNFKNMLNEMSVASDPTISPVRCVGNHNKNKAPAFPRMHNKFLIFCKVAQEPSEYDPLISNDYIVPEAVWTGSYNLTKNAQLSFENAVLIRKKEIAQAYYQEYGQIASLSEPLDWSSDWVAPEWRVGT